MDSDELTLKDKIVVGVVGALISIAVAVVVYHVLGFVLGLAGIETTPLKDSLANRGFGWKE